MPDTADAATEKVFDPDFVWSLGAFFAQWATLELVTSYGICKFLKISFEDAHILTSGMEFGRKSMLLRNLAYRSDAPRKGPDYSLTCQDSKRKQAQRFCALLHYVRPANRHVHRSKPRWRLCGYKAHIHRAGIFRSRRRFHEPRRGARKVPWLGQG